MPISVNIPIAWACRLLLIIMVLGLAACTKPIVKDTDAPTGPEYMAWLPKTCNDPAFSAQVRLLI